MTAKLIISTLLKLVYWDGSQAYVFHEGDMDDGVANYYGITWNPDGIMYVSGCLDSRFVLYKFDMSTLQEIGVLHGELHEVHQILWYDDKLYVANTGKNRVDVWHNDLWHAVAWNPSHCDVEHINSIWSDGQNMYVVEYRHKVSEMSAVRICTMDLDLLNTIDIGPNVHNVYREGNCIYNLTSPHNGDPAGMIITDLIDGTQRRVDKSEWGMVLMRGLVRVNDGWYVGMSPWKTDRSKRRDGDAVIAQLNNDFEEVDRITLPDYGPVCSIRALGVRNPSHNGIVMDVL